MQTNSDTKIDSKSEKLNLKCFECLVEFQVDLDNGTKLLPVNRALLNTAPMQI